MNLDIIAKKPNISKSRYIENTATLAILQISIKRFIHSPAEKKARTLRSSAGRVRKSD